jgi:hypothetical protein
MDPWHDYLAFPVAPLVLVTQVSALFLRPRWVRLVFAGGCTAAIAAMFAYVESLYVPASEGVNIGAGILGLCLFASIALLVVALAREGIALLWRGFGGAAKPPRV